MNSKKQLKLQDHFDIWMNLYLRDPGTTPKERWQRFRANVLNGLFIGFENFERDLLEQETLKSIRGKIARAKRKGEKSIQIAEFDFEQHLRIENNTRSEFKPLIVKQRDLYKIFRSGSTSKMYNMANFFFDKEEAHSVLKEREVGIWVKILYKLLAGKIRGKRYRFTITRKKAPLPKGAAYWTPAFGCGWNAVITVSWK